MSETASPTAAGPSGWIARLTHESDGVVSYTVIGRTFDTRQEAELTLQCWWSTGYGRRSVVAVHVRRAGLEREVRELDWLPVPPGAKEACLLMSAYRPRTEPPGTLHLVPLVGGQS
jgi:hypothetical protein